MVVITGYKIISTKLLVAYTAIFQLVVNKTQPNFPDLLM